MTTATTATTAPRLTDHDRWVIGQARELAALRGADVIGAHVGEANPDLVYPCAFGHASQLLGELAFIAERLGGGDSEAKAEPTLHQRRMQALREGSPAVQDGPYAYIGRDGYMGGTDA